MQECKNLKDYIQTSVDNVTKILDKSEEGLKRKSVSPKKRSTLNIQNFLSVKEYRALNKI